MWQISKNLPYFFKKTKISLVNLNQNKNKMPENTKIMDEKLIDFIKRIEIPKNPLSFYINAKRVEKSLSE